jgi:AraC-like DNA-binding protein
MIKASFEVLQPLGMQSFILRRFDKFGYDAPYHYHPEFELTYIIKGHGKRYVGSRLDEFDTGDLVLMGPNLPHCWKLETPVEESEGAGAVVIQFAADFLGDAFFQRDELQHIKLMLKKSSAGICFKGKARERVNKKILKLTEENDHFKILIGMLDILQDLAVSKEYQLLNEQKEAEEQQAYDQERINPVFAYLVENFRNQVSLDEVASVANMTPNAFCKFFKRITRKTFMETVITYRLNYAIQQLVQTDYPISQVAFESGFGDVSHFYKTFKQKMKMSPLSYRKRFTVSLTQQVA